MVKRCGQPQWSDRGVDPRPPLRTAIRWRVLRRRGELEGGGERGEEGGAFVIA